MKHILLILALLLLFLCQCKKKKTMAVVGPPPECLNFWSQCMCYTSPVSGRDTSAGSSPNSLQVYFTQADKDSCNKRSCCEFVYWGQARYNQIGDGHCACK